MDSLQQFSRHVPQILRHQILLDLVKEYLRNDSGVGPILTREPSMQRFKGALLFIDISGFTVLSQKLDIESLKNNINDYFTKMLTIIQKWGGDVIKFAGDALYIIWQVRENEKDSSGLDPLVPCREDSRGLDALNDMIGFPRIMSSREAVDRAASCALDICASCGDYEVKLQVQDSRRGSINAFQYKSASVGDAAEEITYLNVHAGLSYGTMAGIDIGTEGRWEYFLAGAPLADVAAAEEKAKKGDVVICKEAHELWHGDHAHLAEEEGELPCGCRLFEESFYFVTQSDTVPIAPVQTLRRKSSRARLYRKDGMKDILTQGNRMHEDFTSEIDLVYETIRPTLEIIYMKIVLDNTYELDDNSLADLRTDFDYFYENECRRWFSHWMVKAMTDELAKHVHDVERKTHAFHEPYLRERYYEAVQQWKLSERSRSGSIMIIPGLESHNSINSADLTTRELGIDLRSVLTETRLQKSQYHNVFTGSTSIAAEIFLHSSEKRSLVTVMFVKIESISIEIREYEGKRDHHNAHHLERLLGFIPRCSKEYEEDIAALNRLQRCYQVLHEAIYSTEGQLRQFIIDDKGTVCIATFGLMGSVSLDNAASAIACAEKIILGLEGIDLNARIGVTTGEAYCGVVGSSIRHEYAVMGPSTNLSARLMCRAEARSIICDETTYGQDRANKFILLDELKDVKGYSHPVKIFQPRSSVDLLNSNLIHDVQGKSGKTVRSAIITSKFVKGVYNVMKKVKKNVLFAAKISKARSRIRALYDSEFEFLCEDRLKAPIKSGNERGRRSSVSEKKVDIYRTLHGRYHTIKNIFESIIPSFGTIQNVVFEIDSMCRMVVVGSSVGGGKSAILSAISLKLQTASENDPQLNFFLVSDNTFSKLRLKATVPLSYWGFILFDLLKIVATNFQMTVDPTLTPLEQSRLRYLHTFDSLMEQLPEQLRDAKHRHLLLRLMKLDNSLGKSAASTPASDGTSANTAASETTLDSVTAANTAANANSIHAEFSTTGGSSTNHHFNRDELEILMEMIVNFVDLIPKIMNCAMILVLDDAHFLDSWSLRALHQAWLRVRGVSMILSFNPTQYQATIMVSNSNTTLTSQDSFFQSSSSFALPRKSSMMMNRAVNPHSDDIFAEYEGSDRFVYIELPSLQLEDTKLMARDILGSTMELNETELQQLFDISNGNPLYTVELMYAILGNEGRVDNPTVYTKSPRSSSFSYDGDGNMINLPTSRSRDFRVYFNKSKRLEEVIYYKLDQLHAHAQVLLKAASVAVSNGRTFTLELIYFMLDQSELFTPTTGNTGAIHQSTSLSNLTSSTILDESEDDGRRRVRVHPDTSDIDNENPDGDSKYLMEQIIPFLIEYKIFVRVAQPRVLSSTSGGSSTYSTSSNANSQIYASPPPRASRLMQEQYRVTQLERKQRKQQQGERDRSRDHSFRSPTNKSNVQFQFDLDSLPNVTVDEYEDDDDDEDEDEDEDEEMIPEHIRANKRRNRRHPDEEASSDSEQEKPIVYYEFIAPIEQSTIYRLITDDQRKYFHERVASFYRESLLDFEEHEEQEVVPLDLDSPSDKFDVLPGNSHPPSMALGTTTNSTDDLWLLPGEEDGSPSRLMKLKLNEGESPENLLEEAFHWENANFLSTALRTYMRSGELEKQRENEAGWIAALQHALRVYKTIEQEYYQGELPLMPNQKLPYPELIIKILLGHNTKDTDVVLYLKSVEKDMNHVWEIFEHDLELIPLVCSLHLALADIYLLSWGTLGEIATMAGVALKLMLAMRYQEIFHASSNAMNPSMFNRRRSNSGANNYVNNNHSSAGGYDANGHRHAHHTLLALHHFHTASVMNVASPSAPVMLHNAKSTMYTSVSTVNNYVTPNLVSNTNFSFSYRDLFHTKTFSADPHHLISTLHIIHNTVMRYERPDDRDGTYYYYIAFKMGELIVDVNDETQNICLKAMKALRGKDYNKVADTITPLLSDSRADLLAKSAQRVHRFGVDLLPSIVSELSQSFFLTQDKHRFHELLEKPLYETLLRLPHLPSVENALLSLMVLLTYSEDFRLYRKMRTACKELFVDRREQLVLIQGKFQEMVQCWARSFLALYCPADVPIPQRDKLTLSGILTGMDMAETLFDNVQPDTDPDEREMTNVEVKSLLRYGATMESLALQMVCGLMLFVPRDEAAQEDESPFSTPTPPSASSISARNYSNSSNNNHEVEIKPPSTPLQSIIESDEQDAQNEDNNSTLDSTTSPVASPDRTKVMSREASSYVPSLGTSISDTDVPTPTRTNATTTANKPTTSGAVAVPLLWAAAAAAPAPALSKPPTAVRVDELFSRWWDRMFTDLYTLRYLHILNILNPLLLLCRVLQSHQTHLVLPETEARILLFYARFKTEIIHVCKKHRYLVAMDKFLMVEQVFVERRKHRGGRTRALSSSAVSPAPGDASSSDHHTHVLRQLVDNDHNQQPEKAASTGVLQQSPRASHVDPVVTRAAAVPQQQLPSRHVSNRRTFTPRSLQEIIRTVEKRSQPSASNSPVPPASTSNNATTTASSSAAAAAVDSGGAARGKPASRPSLVRSNNSKLSRKIWDEVDDQAASATAPASSSDNSNK